MKKKFKIDGTIIKEEIEKATKTVNKLADNVVSVIDQNDDGKFDLQDVTKIVKTANENVKNSIHYVKSQAEEKIETIKLRSLRPIFTNDFDNGLSMTKLIKVSQRDKKYIEDTACREAVGFVSNVKGGSIVNVFSDSLENLQLNFYPDSSNGFYYADPIDNSMYIALNEYFDYLKAARISELQKLAQDLGAKHFRVTYLEENKSESKKKMSAKANKLANAEYSSEQKNYAKAEIAAENTFVGCVPIWPQLKYFSKDPSIRNLVAMRMNEETPLLHQKLMLKLSNSCGIKENEAVNVDTWLKAVKYSGTASFTKEMHSETHKYFEYEIEF